MPYSGNQTGVAPAGMTASTLEELEAAERRLRLSVT
jgi:hypothetical protein